MPDFINRFGQTDANGNMYLSSTRQSIITSMWCAGSVHECCLILLQSIHSFMPGRPQQESFVSEIFFSDVLLLP